MEGNECYKFSTIQRFIAATGSAPISLALDIGCNLGHVSTMIRQYFPQSFVVACEPVQEYYERACRHLSPDTRVKVFPLAVTAENVFADDLGSTRLEHSVPLQIFRALPESGVGWVGGSHVLPLGSRPEKETGYQQMDASVTAVTLDQLVQAACTLTGRQWIDYVKFDCEGCENSALGCASADTLARIRFISGEYHDVRRFRHVMEKLQRTHLVNLVGEGWGGFFAELRGSGPTILDASSRIGMRVQSSTEEFRVEWDSFRPDYVSAAERVCHGLN